MEAGRKFRLGMSQHLGCPMQFIIVLQDSLYIPRIIGKAVVHGGTIEMVQKMFNPPKEPDIPNKCKRWKNGRGPHFKAPKAPFSLFKDWAFIQPLVFFRLVVIFLRRSSLHMICWLAVFLLIRKEGAQGEKQISQPAMNWRCWLVVQERSKKDDCDSKMADFVWTFVG